jgi:hypothetical protein
MGNNKASKRVTARRAATFLAAIGALVMSSGVALMVAATPANAIDEGATKVGVCHATSSDTNPYVWIVVDDDSTQLEAHLAHRNSPNKKWKSAGTWNGIDHVKGDPKPDYIEGLDEISQGSCEGEVTPPEETLTEANVLFTNPTCDNENTASWTGVGDNATFEVTSGEAAPGADITVTATVKDGFTFADDAQSLAFSYKFAAAEDCTVVSPPETPTTVVSPPKDKTESVAVTPTVVHAGLAGATVQDMRGEQGLALVFAGMVMLVAAGGLRLRGSASRI